MSAFKKSTYIGRGKLYIAAYGATTGPVFIGNVSQLDLKPQEDAQEMRDYTAVGAGLYDSVRTIKGVQVDMTMWDLSPENLKRSLRASTTSYSGTAITDEVVTAHLDTLVELAHLPDLTLTFTVKNSAGSTTYVDGTDYVKSASGFTALSSGTITEAQSLKVTYTSLDADVIEALVAPASDYRLVFEGLNEADSGKAVKVVVHRFKSGPLQNLTLISDTFASQQVTGDALKDLAITGENLSQYFTITRAS